MKRIVGMVLLLLLSAAAGAWLPNTIAAARAEGVDVDCIQVSGSTFCKGQPLTDLPYNFHRHLGGIVAVSCGYERSGTSLINGDLLSLPEMVNGCRTGRYVASLSNGAVWTNFWVDDGRVAQIDRYDANPLEL